jgi:hypothetical protein
MTELKQNPAKIDGVCQQSEAAPKRRRLQRFQLLAG